MPTLAHEGHPGPHVAEGIDSLVFAVPVVVLLLVALWLALRGRSLAAAARRVQRSSQERLAARARLNRLRAGVAIGAAVVLAVAGAILRPTGDTETPTAVSTIEPRAASPDPDNIFPVRFDNFDANGHVEVVVRNSLAEDAFVQCSIAALDEDGELAYEGEWPAYDPEGRFMTSRRYTNRFWVTANDRQRLVVDLKVERPVAELSGQCFRLPHPDELEQPPEGESV